MDLLPLIMQKSNLPGTWSEIEIQLKQSQESLDFALQSGRMGTWDINLETKTLSCSPLMLDLWGISTEDFNGQRSILQSKVHPEDLNKMKAAMDAAILNNTIYELEYRIIPSPGLEKWVLSRGRCTYTPNSEEPIRFSGVVFDITDKKAKEEAIEKAFKARDQFFMVASHELRTPLTCLELQIQVMQWQLQNKEAQEIPIEKIESGLKKQREQILRINRIIEKILDVTKITEGGLDFKYEQFDLSDMVTGVIDQFKSIAHSFGVDIDYNPKQGIHGTWDRFRLEQVLVNLLMNAIRYGNKKPIQIQVSKEGEHARLSVKDEGIGINPQDHKRIFKRFEGVFSNNEVGGIGLGLYISNNIVRAHGGEIRLKSEAGKGSEFAVILPCQGQFL